MSASAVTCLYEEEQNCLQPWRWVLIAIIAPATLISFVLGLHEQIESGEPWDKAVLESLIVLAMFVVVLAVVLPLLLGRIRLRVQLDAEHLQVRWAPFIYKSIPLARITRGVRLEFTEGKPLLIGSQRAEELAAALTAAKKSDLRSY